MVSSVCVCVWEKKQRTHPFLKKYDYLHLCRWGDSRVKIQWYNHSFSKLNGDKKRLWVCVCGVCVCACVWWRGIMGKERRDQGVYEREHDWSDPPHTCLSLKNTSGSFKMVFWEIQRYSVSYYIISQGLEPDLEKRSHGEGSCFKQIVSMYLFPRFICEVVTVVSR